MQWEEYAKKMQVDDINEVDCLEFSLTRGDCHVRCLMLLKASEDEFQFFIQRPVPLVHMENAEYKEDKHGNFIPPEEVDGEHVFGLLGDYYVSHYSEPFPDDNNYVTFSDFYDQKVDDWLSSNGWWGSVDEITPEQTTKYNI